MRHTTRALVGVLLFGWCCQATAAEQSGFRWWPFNRDRSEAAELTGNSLGGPSPAGPLAAMPPQQPSSVPQYHSTEDVTERRWMLQSPLARVSWPRIHMPEVSIPRPRLPRPQFWPKRAEVDDARNAWMQNNPQPNRPSPLQAVKEGAHRVGDSTRSAWHKTVDVLTPGDGGEAVAPQIAAGGTRPPLWKRMFGAEERQQQGPRTVTEWMAQDRLDP